MYIEGGVVPLEHLCGRCVSELAASSCGSVATVVKLNFKPDLTIHQSPRDGSLLQSTNLSASAVARIGGTPEVLLLNL